MTDAPRDTEMSEGEYQTMCGMLDDLGAVPFESGAPIEAPAGRWRVTSGALLPIDRMTDAHLSNAVALCERIGTGGHSKCQELRAEQQRRAARDGTRGMSIKERIAHFIARGAIQLSRKYKLIGVPPALTSGARNYIDMLQERDPVRWQRFEEQARDAIVHADRSTHVELTYPEFNEWLEQRGCKPLADPPEPYATWGDYWRENDVHPDGVRRKPKEGEPLP